MAKKPSYIVLKSTVMMNRKKSVSASWMFLAKLSGFLQPYNDINLDSKNTITDLYNYTIRQEIQLKGNKNN